jgi:carboxypeptidase C (cathepsin A)
MKKTLLMVWVVALAFGAGTPGRVLADETEEGGAAGKTSKASEGGAAGAKEKAGEGSQQGAGEAKKAEKEEKPKERRGSVVLGGVPVSYVAQTGTVPVLKEDGSRQANVFYVYYAATDAAGQRLAVTDPNRPILFCFNGGPGASAVWLHLGGLGPKRVNLPPEGLSPSSYARAVENPDSVLDAADLVFVDPVSTGLSRAEKGEKAEQFFGVKEDIRCVGEFVRLFTTREQRWGSPKYLCGESYGVLRVAGLAEYLQSKHGWYPEGLVLLSGLVDFQTILSSGGNELPYVLFLPTMTATAHYHGKLAEDLQRDLGAAVEASREFARNEYAVALLKGNELSAAARAEVAAKVARFTGLPVSEVLTHNLRLNPFYFRKALLRGEGKVVGRFDARVLGLDHDPSELMTGYDPSYSNIAGGFASAINGYIRTELGYESDHPYHILNSLPWKWHSFENRYVSTGEALAEAIQDNPAMRILVLCGRRDLAVPEDSMRYSLAHLRIPEASRGNIRFSLYESGHMMYLFKADAEKLRADLTGFLRKP